MLEEVATLSSAMGLLPYFRIVCAEKPLAGSHLLHSRQS